MSSLTPYNSLETYPTSKKNTFFTLYFEEEKNIGKYVVSYEGVSGIGVVKILALPKKGGGLTNAKKMVDFI